MFDMRKHFITKISIMLNFPLSVGLPKCQIFIYEGTTWVWFWRQNRKLFIENSHINSRSKCKWKSFFWYPQFHSHPIWKILIVFFMRILRPIRKSRKFKLSIWCSLWGTCATINTHLDQTCTCFILGIYYILYFTSWCRLVFLYPMKCSSRCLQIVQCTICTILKYFFDRVEIPDMHPVQDIVIYFEEKSTKCRGQSPSNSCMS